MATKTAASRLFGRTTYAAVPAPLARAVRLGLGRTAAGIAGASIVLTAGLTPLYASADEIVYLQGFNVTSDSGPAQAALGLLSEDDRDNLCDLDNLTAVQEQATVLAVQVSEQLGNIDAGLQAEFDNAALTPFGVPVGPALAQACEGPDVQMHMFNMVYSTCRMTMRDGRNAIDVRFPPGTDDGFLTFLDPVTLEAIVLPYQNAGDTPDSVNFGQLLNEQTGVVQGFDGGRGVERLTTTEQRTIDVNGRAADLTGQAHSFEFTFDLDIARSMPGMAELFAGGQAQSGDSVDPAQMQALLAMLPTPRIHSYGTALIAADAPELRGALGIIRAFYQTFADSMGAEGSYLAGLYNHELLAAGFPLRIEQTTSMQMASGGLFGGIVGAMGAGQTSKSSTFIWRVVGPLSTDSDYCSQSIVPPNYTVTNPMSDIGGPTTSAAPGAAPGAAGGPGPGAGAASAAPGMPPADEVAAAMAEVNEAFANMSAEDRAAMQQFAGNFGQLLGGALGGQGFPGAGAGSQPGAAGAGAAPAASAQPARARSGQSSAALMTDDLTQSVQNMLQALGYDPGNTTGEASLQTTIAISQFQAEKGLEVTGEVTPQLVGILAAEVDSR